jgi:hypothetical protein
MTRLLFHTGSCWPVPLDKTMRQAAAVGYAREWAMAKAQLGILFEGRFKLA